MSKMDIKKEACIFILAVCMLCGCEGVGSKPAQAVTKKSNYTTFPNLTRYGKSDEVSGGELYWYLVDNRTGVVYLEYDSYMRHAISVMLNADGTPVTKDQLELED